VKNLLKATGIIVGTLISDKPARLVREVVCLQQCPVSIFVE
jgi:hypothetical protein